VSEPYPFPKLPDGVVVSFDNPKLSPICLGIEGESPLVMTPPCEATNYIGFFFKHGKELFRFAIVMNETGDGITVITEDGKETSLQDVKNLAFKCALGTERYEIVKDVVEANDK
jgi:hypothetical protein